MSDMMTFPDTWEEFEKLYGFNDAEEIYTNNSRLIPSFRVKQWLDHLSSVQQEQLDCEDCIKHGVDWEYDRVHCHKGDVPDTNVGELISRQKAKDAIDMALDHIDHVPPWVYDNLLNALNEVPSVEPTHKTPSITLGALDCVDRRLVSYKLTDLVNEFEEILSHIREREENDSVCGLCEYDGAYMGQSGDWCNECPGFDKADCFKLKDKYKKEWLELMNTLPSVQPEFSNNSKELEKNSKELENKNGELISRQEAIKAILGEPPEVNYPIYYAEKIRELPSVQPKERCIATITLSEEDLERIVKERVEEIKELLPQKGKWIDYSSEGFVECPFCHSATNCDDNKDELHYCFSCGADMRSEAR